MVATVQRARQKTYVPNKEDIQEAEQLINELEDEIETNGDMTLTSASGKQYQLPSKLFDVLQFIGMNLAKGHGVTVVPRETKLTSQDAADFLGISRPTLVKILDSGKIPFEKVGRHRRVTLDNLLRYQEKEQARRNVLLAQMARNDQESGMLELTYQDMDSRD
jgi:excisionase family DNA binding protein